MPFFSFISKSFKNLGLGVVGKAGKGKGGEQEEDMEMKKRISLELRDRAPEEVR